MNQFFVGFFLGVACFVAGFVSAIILCITSSRREDYYQKLADQENKEIDEEIKEDNERRS